MTSSREVRDQSRLESSRRFLEKEPLGWADRVLKVGGKSRGRQMLSIRVETGGKKKSSVALY